MSLISRMFASADDLELMKDLLRASKRVYPCSGLHIGELDWWAFYDTSGIPMQDKARLWFDGDQLVAWTWVRLPHADYEMFVHPAYRGAPQHNAAVTQAIDALSAAVRPLLRQDDSPPQIAGYASEDEAAHITLLQQQGFTSKPFMVSFTQDLRRTLPTPVLPDGFTFLDRVRLEDADQRALAHKDAFQPHSRMNPDLYRAFMQATGYDPELDIAIAAADGSIVSFAMGWIDADNRLGIFEPVGTRHTYHRRGLGRAALLEGLRRMQARGVETALVNCEADKPGNILFYQSAGFQPCNRVMVLSKVLW